MPIYQPIKQEITTAAFVAITTSKKCSCFSLWTEDGSDYIISNTAAGTVSVTVPSGFPFSIAIDPHTTDEGAILCYAKGTSTVNLVGLITR